MQKIFKWLMLVGSALALLCSASVAGQDAPREAPRRRMTPQLALAVLTVSEAGWEAEADMLGIHAVILRTQQRIGGSYVGAAGAYARRLIGRQGQISRPWLWDLNSRGTEPARWPTETWVSTSRGAERRPHAPWSVFRERWLATYERAGQVVEYRLDDWSTWGPCDRVPDDWGGAMDMERARRLGLVQLACPGTANAFFVRPSTLEDEEQLGG
jgi:hypothetical protein